MLSIKEQSLVESAERVIREKKEPLNLYELFNIICAEKGYNEEKKTSLISQFYTDMITSAKFVYSGDNMWDLKDFQKTDLSEKDGSFYKEYTKIPDLGDEDGKAAKPATKKKTRKAKKVVKEKIVKEVVEEVVEEVIEATPKEVVEKVEPKVSKDVAPVTKEDKKAKDSEGKETEYEEEIFEEFVDEFDEEKYNEYMDTYEDKYDEK